MSVVVDLTGAALVRAKREIERLEDEREDAILLLARDSMRSITPR